MVVIIAFSLTSEESSKDPKADICNVSKISIYTSLLPLSTRCAANNFALIEEFLISTCQFRYKPVFPGHHVFVTFKYNE